MTVKMPSSRKATAAIGPSSLRASLPRCRAGACRCASEASRRLHRVLLAISAPRRDGASAGLEAMTAEEVGGLGERPMLTVDPAHLSIGEDHRLPSPLFRLFRDMDELDVSDLDREVSSSRPWL